MGKSFAFIGSIIVGVLAYGLISSLEEFWLFIPLSLAGAVKWIIAILLGIGTYKYLSRKLSVAEAQSQVMDKKEQIKKWSLYVLLTLQLIGSAGYANEFDDHLAMLVLATIFFLAQIYFLFVLTEKKVATVFVLLISFMHLFSLVTFASEGAGVINNKWPAELYYATRSWVIWMAIGALVLDVIKLGVLYRNRLRLKK
jgi:hypothetical protein